MTDAEHKFANEDGSSFTVHGTLIGHGDTRSDGKDRWVEIGIFRVEPEGYAVHRMGASRLYHRVGNDTCARKGGSPMGAVATRKDLPKDAASCDLCEPPWPDELEPGEEVLYEFPRHDVKWLPDVAAVTADLGGVRGYSYPARVALGEARKNDEAFKDVSIDVEIGKGTGR